MFHGWSGVSTRESWNSEFEEPKAIGLSCEFTVRKDLKQLPPARSWLLYNMELDSKGFNNAVELNLITQADNQTFFVAIYRGKERYRFLAQVKIDEKYKLEFEHREKEIVYRLTSKETEEFTLQGDAFYKAPIEPPAPERAFWGIEWWNRLANDVYPIRYECEMKDPSFVTSFGERLASKLERDNGIQIGYGNVPDSWPANITHNSPFISLKRHEG